MKDLGSLFGESPFEHIVQHARKVHECVNLVRPVADAVLAGDMAKAGELQERMSATEFEADKIKDEIRQKLPNRFFLPVDRTDILNFVRQLDRMGDEAEDFAVVATFRRVEMPVELRREFSALVDKAIQTSESLLAMAEELATLQKEAFEGEAAQKVLERIDGICRLEWETDKISRGLARHYFSMPGMDPILIMIMDKLCGTLTGIADHAENVGKSLRLMILKR